MDKLELSDLKMKNNVCGSFLIERAKMQLRLKGIINKNNFFKKTNNQEKLKLFPFANEE